MSTNWPPEDEPAPLDLGDDTFSVLFVCTANICRSPMAEHMFQHALRGRLGRQDRWRWSVASAGTHAVRGAVAHDLARAALHERGVPIEGAPARQATLTMIEDADLILTAGRAQRSWIVERAPSSVRRVATLRQFARQCVAGRELSPGPVWTGAAMVALSGVGRTRLQPVGADDDHIDDPIGGDLGDFRACAELIADCMIDMLGPMPPC